jgi:hypothetical protein
MTDVLSTSDAALANFLANFATVGGANSVALGTTASEWTDMTTASSDFSEALTDHVAAQNTARGARQVKDSKRGTGVSKARVLIKKINANPNVSPLLRQQLGLPEKDTERSKPPVPTVAPAPVVEKVGGSQIVVKAINPETDSVAKPEGAKTIRIFEKIVAHNEPAPTGIDQMQLADVVTAGRITRSYGSADLCKTAYLAMLYVNSAGEAGPVSVIVPASIAA